MEQFQRVDSPLQQHLSPKQSHSIATTDSPLHLNLNVITQQKSSVHEIFQSEPQPKMLSSKITKKSVNWLFRVSWEKNCSLQSAWTAVTLFYGYRRRKAINKQFLECLPCLQLSTKFHESVPLTTSQLLLSCSQAVSRDLFTKYQLELLEIFNFQIYIPHALETLANCKALSEEQRWKVLFLAELYLCKDDRILFDWQKCEKLIELTRDQVQDSELQCLQIRDLISQTSNNIIFKRYGSKFDVESFTNTFR